MLNNVKLFNILRLLIFVQLWRPSDSTPINCTLCSKEYRCWFPPNNEKCGGFGVAFKMIDNSTMELHLYNTVTEIRKRYIALGLNTKQTMVGANVIECSAIGDKTSPSFKFSYNDGRNNVRIPEAEKLEKSYFSNTTIEHTDGVLHCHGHIYVSGSDLHNWVFKNNPVQAYYVLASHGWTTNSGLQKHDEKGITSDAFPLSQVFVAKTQTTTLEVPTTVSTPGAKQAPNGNELWTPSDAAPNVCSLCGKEYNCFFPYTNQKCKSFGIAYKMLTSGTMNLHIFSSKGVPMKERYVATGFNTQRKMKGARVIECSSIGNGPMSFKFSYNKAVNIRIYNAEILESTHFTNTKYEIVNNMVHCQATVNISGWIEDERVFAYKTGQKYFILVAYGLTDKKGLQVHTEQGISADSYTFQEISELKIDHWSKILIRIHATLMLLAWFCLVPTAVLFARFLRGSWPNKKPLDLLIWFHVHRTCNVVALIFMLLSVICVLIAKDFEFAMRGVNAGYWQLLHVLIGLAAVVLGLSQPVNSLFRCHPGTPKRPIFNWVHRSIGLIAVTCAATATCIAAIHFDFIWPDNNIRKYIAPLPYLIFLLTCIASLWLDCGESEKNPPTIMEKKKQIIVMAVLSAIFLCTFILIILVATGK